MAIALSTQIAYRLLRTKPSSIARPILCLAIFAFQLIYETIIATLSLTYMAPNCKLEEQWARLYKSKDGNAIQRIQDAFQCCGFNSVVDRAWPFPHGRPEDGHGANQCQLTYGRDRPCVGPWRQAEQMSSRLFFTVAIVIFAFKVIILVSQLRKTSWTQSMPWMRFFENLTSDDLKDSTRNNRARVRLISDADEANVEEQYHDEIDGGSDEIAGADGNNSRLRVEPSGLLADGAGQWR